MQVPPSVQFFFFSFFRTLLFCTIFYSFPLFLFLYITVYNVIVTHYLSMEILGTNEKTKRQTPPSKVYLKYSTHLITSCGQETIVSTSILAWEIKHP